MDTTAPDPEDLERWRTDRPGTVGSDLLERARKVAQEIQQRVSQVLHEPEGHLSEPGDSNAVADRLR
jgi:hypothetical protein